MNLIHKAPTNVKPHITDAEKIDNFSTFFDVEIGRGGKKEIKINHFNLIERLKELGLVRHEEKDKLMYLYVEDNVCTEVEQRHIVDVFEKHIKDFPFDKLKGGVTKEKLLSKVFAGASTYFAPAMMARLKTDLRMDFQKHEKDQAFFYYKNGFVKVTEKGTELLPYSELKNKIWKNQILPRNYEGHVDYSDFSYYKFLNNISGNYDGKNVKRYNSIKSVIGYLLHDFFDTKLQSIIFTDSRISMDGEAKGRSGKSLVCKGIGLMVDPDRSSPTVYCEIDAKKIDKSQFAMQLVGYEAKIVCFNDIKRNFDIEHFYNDILDGLVVEKKGKDRFRVKVKIVFSTNKLLRIKDDSAKDRFLEFELADYYHLGFSPKDEFNEWFFSSWGQGQWRMYDSLMLDCVKHYLKVGLVAPDSINLNRRKLIEETNPLFIKWIEDFFSRKIPDPDISGKEIFENEIFGKQYDKKNLFQDFKDSEPDFSGMKQNTFTIWLKTFSEYTPKIGSFKERKSSGDYKIQFFPKKKEKVETKEENPDWDELNKIVNEKNN